MAPYRALAALAVALVAQASSACLTLSEPGRFDPPEAHLAPVSGLRVELGEVRWAEGAVAEGEGLEPETGARDEVPPRIRASLSRHLEQESPFVLAKQGEPVDLVLEGVIQKVRQPGHVFSASENSGSSSGEGAAILIVLVAVYSVAILFGAPTDCRTAEVELILRAREAEYRQIVAEWRASASENDCAGLWYDGWPSNEALQVAAAELTRTARTDSGLVEDKLARWKQWHRTYAVESLEPPLSPASIAAIARALGDKEAGIRVRAARALAAADPGSSLARSALSRAIDDRDAGVRREAITALAVLGQAEPEVLERLARHDPDREVRETARQGGVRIRLEAAARQAPVELAAPVRALGDPDLAARRSAIDQLASAGSSAHLATAALIVALGDPSPEVRRAALAALPKIEARGPALAGALDAAAADPELGALVTEVRRQLEFQRLARGEGLVELASTPAFEAPPLRVDASAPVVAVFDLRDSAGKLDSRRTEQLTEYLSVRLTASGVYRTVPRSELRSRLLLEKKEAYRACYDESCQIELGRAVAANKALSAKLLRIGNRCTLTATLFDLRTEVAERAATQEGACTDRALTAAIDRVVSGLTGAR